ncbi:hypothetical protein [Vibrio rarus]|uniref:hypothetical protein n=1 Tax=Vibrio rarus TaxID=413403 RepID=UPI0021C2D50E|nr:hypothetical protein [Vibrio rarus]
MLRMWFIFVCITLLPFLSQAKEGQEASFEYPFLLGEWYIVNSEPDANQDDFLAIRMRFNSQYYFTLDIQKRDYSVERWEGEYHANDDTLMLGSNSQAPQVYAYKTTHNRLNLNGIIFKKNLSKPLAGLWSSRVLSGDDLLASKVKKVDLVLQPDFIFMFRTSGIEGQESVRHGIYYIEDDHLVLLYENGETQSNYNLQDDTLTLSGSGIDMYAELTRVR